MIKLFKKLAANKKGSELVQTIFIVAVVLVAGGLVTGWFISTVNKKMNEADSLDGGIPTAKKA
jgi:hypothetical protein